MHLTDHVCGECFGRIVEYRRSGVSRFMCADCGLRAAGHVDRLCTCGVRLRNGDHAGMHCERQRAHKPGISPVVCAIYDGQAMPAASHQAFEDATGRPGRERNAKQYTMFG